MCAVLADCRRRFNLVFVAAGRCCVLLIVPSLATGLGRKEKTPGPHIVGRVQVQH
jgi:hypothetical protein